MQYIISNLHVVQQRHLVQLYLPDLEVVAAGEVVVLVGLPGIHRVVFREETDAVIVPVAMPVDHDVVAVLQEGLLVAT